MWENMITESPRVSKIRIVRLEWGDFLEVMRMWIFEEEFIVKILVPLYICDGFVKITKFSILIDFRKIIVYV